MALLTVSIERTANAERKRGVIAIAVKATGNVLASHEQNFPPGTADNYILNELLGKAKDLMRELAVKQVPASFSFEVDSDQLRLRRLFEL